MKSSSEKPKILVIGLGEIGYNNCEYMTNHGLNVDGYDINDDTIQYALSTKVIQRKATNFKGYDFYVICVSTHNPQNMFQPSLDSYFTIINQLAHEGKYGSLVTIESTVTKGSSQRALAILNHRLHVAHAPHRFYCNERILHGINQPRVLGGCENCCTAEALYFYQKLLDIPMQTVNKVELAELSKIIENSYRFLEISFVEELKTYCDLNNLNFTELREAINTKWNIQLLEARQGIGGHCLPKDSKMYMNLLKKTLSNPIIESAICADRDYKKHSQRLFNITECTPAFPLITKRKKS